MNGFVKSIYFLSLNGAFYAKNLHFMQIHLKWINLKNQF